MQFYPEHRNARQGGNLTPKGLLRPPQPAVPLSRTYITTARIPVKSTPG